jgi:hypothetical protein
MTQRFSPILIIALVLGMMATTSTKADAAFFAAVCNDAVCAGGDDMIVQDGSGSDTIGLAGAINFSAVFGGYSLLVNTSQSKPIVGSPTEPELDLTFTASTQGAAAPIYLFASDTDFTAGQSFGTLAIGGTNSGGSGTEIAAVWGGSSNTAFDFSNLISALGPVGGVSYNDVTSGNYTASVNPYSLTIGVAISRSTKGSSTGDLNFTSSPVTETAAVPEPASLVLLGTGLAAAWRRRKANA